MKFPVLLIAFVLNLNTLPAQPTGIIINDLRPMSGYRTPSYTPDPDSGDVFLRDFPAYNWSYGCTPTAAAMLLAFYDRGNYPGIYQGPAQNGRIPVDNTTSWKHGECPLSASHMGTDGRTTFGNVDDYWDSDDVQGIDAFIADNRAEHQYGDCVADFMGTSQNYWNVPDGGTMFYFPPDGSRIFDDTLYENSNPRFKDGCHGIRQFIEARGYNVKNNFNQAANTAIHPVSGGFSYDDIKKEIDQGRPVLLSLMNSHYEGHSMIVFGYNDCNDEKWLWVNDTWDNSGHKMNWNGYYSGYNLFITGVTVIELEPSPFSIPDGFNFETPGQPSSTGISHYPNPADEWVIIEYSLPEVKEGCSLKIFNATGQMTEDLTITNAKGKITLDASNMSPGQYYFILQNGNSTEKGKIIITH